MTRFYDALMIDLDGTLVDTMGDFVAVLQACLDDMSLPSVGREAVFQMVGKGSEHLIRSTLKHVVREWDGLSPDDQTRLYQQAWSRYQVRYPQLNGKHSSVYPGVVEGLQSLKDSGIRMACLTNKPLAFARVLLEQKGLRHFFDCVHGGDSFEQKKPHPFPLLGTCAVMQTVPGRTLMVGDSCNDAFAARAAGCPIALVSYGYNHSVDVASIPHDFLLDSLEELPNLCVHPRQ
jgi:phosphoglycolate phosphatase